MGVGAGGAHKFHQHISSGIRANVRMQVAETKGFIGARLCLKGEVEKDFKTTDIRLSESLLTQDFVSRTEDSVNV